MKTWRIPFCEETSGYIEIVAENKQKALKKFRDGDYEEFEIRGYKNYNPNEIYNAHTLEKE